jgi:NAD(P)-dependent dehydrogenase (short-subunit alcohol dehydrogenase family)
VGVHDGTVAVGGAVSFLLSRDAAWVAGQTPVVDGGVTLGSGL